MGKCQQVIKWMRMISAETAEAGPEWARSHVNRHAFTIYFSVGHPVNAQGVTQEAGTALQADSSLFLLLTLSRLLNDQ